MEYFRKLRVVLTFLFIWFTPVLYFAYNNQLGASLVSLLLMWLPGILITNYLEN
jgi:hypothetical protein